MSSPRRLAGILALCVTLAPASAHGAEAATGDGGVTPVAREGTPLAAKRGVSKSQLRSMLKREMNSVGGASGAYVYDIEANQNRLLFSDAGQSRRILASNSKLFTTAAFLGRFGANGRLETRLYKRGKLLGPRKRILDGSLVLVGDGDPALAQSSFANANGLPLTEVDSLAQAVKRAGITRIRGSILADPTVFDSRKGVPTPGAAPGPGDLPTLSGLSFNRGTEGGGYASNPARSAGEELLRELRDRNIRVSGSVKVGGAPNKLLATRPFAKVRSPAAQALIKQTNVPSDNFYAEMLLKRLGASPRKQGTTRRGALRAERYTRRFGSKVSLVNGSGLARSNKASPKNVVQLLSHMRRTQGFNRPFYESLAVAGRTGTLAGRMRGTAAQGRCRGKTGTINGVSALSGYCNAGKGIVAFSILMNGVNVDSARNAQDAMTAAIARYR